MRAEQAGVIAYWGPLKTQERALARAEIRGLTVQTQPGTGLFSLRNPFSRVFLMQVPSKGITRRFSMIKWMSSRVSWSKTSFKEIRKPSSLKINKQ